jgi:hypothetical protein
MSCSNQNINQTFIIESPTTGVTIDIYVTGGTFNGNTLYLTNNSGATFEVTGFTSSSTFTGGTVTGATNFIAGLTASTISATTITATNYIGLPKDIFVTGGTFSPSSSTIIFVNNTGGTFNVTGITVSTSGAFTGGTVTGSTQFTNGLSANTFSATTYLGLPLDVFVTGGTFSSSSSTIIFTNNTGGTFNVSGISSSGIFTGGTVSGATIFTNGLTANTISATTYLNLPVDYGISFLLMGG